MIFKLPLLAASDGVAIGLTTADTLSRFWEHRAD